jgi:hypothetical protein
VIGVILTSALLIGADIRQDNMASVVEERYLIMVFSLEKNRK